MLTVDSRTAYICGLLLRDKMTSALEEGIGPIALLMYDSRKLAVVPEPGRRRLPRESLDPPESRVLKWSQQVMVMVP